MRSFFSKASLVAMAAAGAFLISPSVGRASFIVQLQSGATKVTVTDNGTGDLDTSSGPGSNGVNSIAVVTSALPGFSTISFSVQSKSAAGLSDPSGHGFTFTLVAVHSTGTNTLSVRIADTGFTSQALPLSLKGSVIKISGPATSYSSKFNANDDQFFSGPVFNSNPAGTTTAPPIALNAGFDGGQSTPVENIDGSGGDFSLASEFSLTGASNVSVLGETFVTTAPPPPSAILFGVGLLSMGFGAWLKNRRKAAPVAA